MKSAAAAAPNPHLPPPEVGLPPNLPLPEGGPTVTVADAVNPPPPTSVAVIVAVPMASGAANNPEGKIEPKVVVHTTERAAELVMGSPN